MPFGSFLSRPALTSPSIPAVLLEGAGMWVIAAWVFVRLFGFVLVTPLVEELAFRGYLMRRLISSDFQSVRPSRFTWLSFIVSSIVFGLLHSQWIAGTLAGMVYAGVVYRTGRVRDAVIAHAVTNALVLAAAFATRLLSP